MASVHFPLDPRCDGVKTFNQNVKDSLDRRLQLGETPDPQTTGEVIAQWTREHRARCEPCQQYGRANLVRLA